MIRYNLYSRENELNFARIIDINSIFLFLLAFKLNAKHVRIEYKKNAEKLVELVKIIEAVFFFISPSFPRINVWIKEPLKWDGYERKCRMRGKFIWELVLWWLISKANDFVQIITTEAVLQIVSVNKLLHWLKRKSFASHKTLCGNRYFFSSCSVEFQIKKIDVITCGQ